MRNRESYAKPKKVVKGLHEFRDFYESPECLDEAV